MKFSVYWPGSVRAKSYLLKSSTMLSKYALKCSLYLRQIKTIIRGYQGTNFVLLLGDGIKVEKWCLNGDVAEQKAEAHVELLCFKVDILQPDRGCLHVFSDTLNCAFKYLLNLVISISSKE